MTISFWNNLHASLMLVASGLVLYLSRIEILVVLFSISFALLLWHKRLTMLNWANVITTARFILISVVIIQATNFSNWQLFIFLGIAVLMDLLDGYVARLTNASSELGFLLDLETDAFFVLVMSFYYYEVEAIPIWVLLPGLMRYLFKITTILLPKSSFEESKRAYASIVAGVYFVVLLLALLASKEFQVTMLFVGGMAIVISFGMSFIEYFRWEEK